MTEPFEYAIKKDVRNNPIVREVDEERQREQWRSLAVAGFRLGESLAWGRHVYVDDLVTLPEARSRGYGAALLAWLADFGRAQGAGQLHLDSGRQRTGAHRFYEREGLAASSLHFRRSL